MFIRKLKKLFLKKILIGKFINYATINTEFEAKIYSPDGVISMNQDAKIMAMKNDGADTVGILVDTNERIHEAIGLNYNDLFVGRERNYIHFKGSGNINVKGTVIEIRANEIDVIANTINFNGIIIQKLESGELALNGKAIAVIGGTIDPLTNQIITSGQL